MATFQNKIYCNNCAKPGHMYNQCKMPILSIGIVVYKEVVLEGGRRENQYLMICRNHTYGFMDFIRGKYSIYNKDCLLHLFNEMTVHEKKLILEETFAELWKYLWNHTQLQNQYKKEQFLSEDKFNTLKNGVLFQNTSFYSIDTLLKESNQTPLWEEPEWGFPKGRRNYNERDYDCALREFREETGYSTNSLKLIENILPFEEIFTGSNYKSYKNKYYVLRMTVETPKVVEHFDKDEVSKMEWKTYEECMECIRTYNLEKRQLITNIHQMLMSYKMTV